MNDLIYFTTFCEPWEYAQLTTPYYSHSPADLISPGACAAVAISNYVHYMSGVRLYLWDSGDFVYGLS